MVKRPGTMYMDIIGVMHPCKKKKCRLDPQKGARFSASLQALLPSTPYVRRTSIHHAFIPASLW